MNVKLSSQEKRISDTGQRPWSWTQGKKDEADRKVNVALICMNTHACRYRPTTRGPRAQRGLGTAALRNTAGHAHGARKMLVPSSEIIHLHRSVLRSMFYTWTVLQPLSEGGG